MYLYRTYPSHILQILLATMIVMATFVRPVLAQNGPEDAPFATMRGTQTPSDKQPITLSASLTENGGTMQSGLVWRIFKTTIDKNGDLELISATGGGTTSIELDPGDYFVNCAFGRASATRKVTIKKLNEEQKITFVLNAGGLVLNATLGDHSEIDTNKLLFAVYQDKGSDRNLIVDNVKPGIIVRLRAGSYEIVSTYGDLNAEAHARLKITAGEITEATLKQNAAVVTLKLVAEKNGEPLANTTWTVLGASGDVLTEQKSIAPSMILAEGDYTAIARNRQSVFEKQFTLTPGPAQHVELLMGKDNAKIGE